jgi:ribosome maturation protein Sdo1
MLIKHQLDDIDKQLRDVGAEGGIQENSAEHKALLEDQKKYRQNLKQVTEEALNPKTRVPHPRPGQIVNGYRFKGGDPKKQSSWEKVS